ncbi:NAD(P)/FAD-dependent oxidoreductase [Dongia sedimenti]|uniref:FAD-binding oxidoreductase n=1 Tax=Dongia sedimenti TaxID=3064282 RepID=A0ABU0YM06_9PROT|nr:FAD-binding oxidoreductase [Rhodospirillaceae bacterium R-7]
MKHLYHPTALDPRTPAPSWWRDSVGAPPAEYAPLQGDVETEVAIIGGGYTGLSAAYHLAKEHGIKAVVLERATPGWGASGRNGGFCCMGGSKLGWKKIITTYGLEEARAFYHAQAESVGLVAGLLEAEGIDADRTESGDVALAHRESMVAELATDAKFMANAFGARHSLLDRDDLKARGLAGPHFHGGVAGEVGFGLNPFKYVTGLARAAAARGATLTSWSPVTAWRREAYGHRLTTPQGSVRAAKVLIATNGYTPEDLHPQFGGRLLPALSSIVVTRSLTEAERAEAGWTSTAPSYDLLNLLHYFRLLPDGRFMFGGRGGVSAEPGALARQSARIEAAFRRYYPAWRDVEITHRWSGFVCLAADLVPHVGAWADEPGIYFAMAYHGNGVALGTWSGRAIARLIGSGETPAPKLMRTPPPRFPLPFLRPLYLRGAYVKFGLEDAFGR